MRGSINLNSSGSNAIRGKRHVNLDSGPCMNDTAYHRWETNQSQHLLSSFQAFEQLQNVSHVFEFQLTYWGLTTDIRHTDRRQRDHGIFIFAWTRSSFHRISWSAGTPNVVSYLGRIHSVHCTAVASTVWPGQLP